MLRTQVPAAPDMVGNTHATATSPAAPADWLAQRFAAVRAETLRLAAPLSAEDAMLQSMPDASPAKWHLAHTTWFFDRFVLQAAGLPPLRPQWNALFNSYYESAGPRHPRPQRGLLSRPTLQDVLDWRRELDATLPALMASGRFDSAALHRVELGLHHEQQHQELLLTDIKHAFSCNALMPAYANHLPVITGEAVPLRWIARDEGVAEIGHDRWPMDSGDFAFDNESPRHRVLLAAHALANRPVSNGEYRQFIEEGGYRRPELWLSEGWATVQAQDWQRPLYWQPDLEHAFTLAGPRGLDPHAPVCHLSYFEADAFARWAGGRLPTEAEWERAASLRAVLGRFADSGFLEPQPAAAAEGLLQLFGDVWEWTASPYTAYPGYRPWPGEVGEYNGKFMCGQWVLRGGSAVTPSRHARASYRNFFPPASRWQFAGLRLAKDRP
ncbi:ergothioneine biosynthesis protein EgtB [Pseudofulvimonas gallinarii]|uniref:Ergothioneine biosynthesis protein EgtB n=2 Tax=Pseudofulvimonas gallinarii TaxID=634155 RepID=A0A4R3L7W7_9GAMM|nr:ergothioneine biosynthesis protein EgtB [Pseudofulvimonas gallinarii]